MSAYLIGQISMKDQDLWRQYVAGVTKSLLPFETKIIFRGKKSAVLAGTQEHDQVVVIEFADQNSLNNWFNSERYQSLIPLRDQAADVIITTYEAH